MLVLVVYKLTQLISALISEFLGVENCVRQTSSGLHDSSAVQPSYNRYSIQPLGLAQVL